jgi:hypothetical protein
MAVLLFLGLCLVFIWAISLLVVSKFFRGMAVAGLGAELLNIASNANNPVWLVTVAIGFMALPLLTTFRRLIFGHFTP